MVVKLKGMFGLVAKRIPVHVHSVYAQFGYQYGVSGQVLRVDYSIYCASPGTYEVQVFAVGKGMSKNGEAHRIVQLKEGYNAFSEYLSFQPDYLFDSYVVSVVVWKPGPFGQTSVPIASKIATYYIKPIISEQAIEQARIAYENWKNTQQAKDAERIRIQHEQYVVSTQTDNAIKQYGYLSGWYNNILTNYNVAGRPDIKQMLDNMRDRLNKHDLSGFNDFANKVHDAISQFVDDVKKQIEATKQKWKERLSDFKNKLLGNTDYDVKSEEDTETIRDLLAQLAENYRAFLDAYKQRSNDNVIYHLGCMHDIKGDATLFVVVWGSVAGNVVTAGLSTQYSNAKKNEYYAHAESLNNRLGECKSYAESIKTILDKLKSKLKPSTTLKVNTPRAINNVFGLGIIHHSLINQVDDGIVDADILDRAIQKAEECRDKMNGAKWWQDAHNAWNDYTSGPIRTEIHDILDRRAGWFKW